MNSIQFTLKKNKFHWYVKYFTVHTGAYEQILDKNKSLNSPLLQAFGVRILHSENLFYFFHNFFLTKIFNSIQTFKIMYKCLFLLGEICKIQKIAATSLRFNDRLPSSNKMAVHKHYIMVVFHQTTKWLSTNII